LIVVESLASSGLVVLMSPLDPRMIVPPALAAVSMGNSASKALLNSARVIVEPPDVNATGDPTGDASGDAMGEAAGLATGDAATLVAVVAVVGIGAAVDVGSSDDESPPQAPTRMAINKTASSMLHGDVRNLRNFVPYPVGCTETCLFVGGTVPKSRARPRRVRFAAPTESISVRRVIRIMLESGTARTDRIRTDISQIGHEFTRRGGRVTCPERSSYALVQW
jgi:hypothetical protein